MRFPYFEFSPRFLSPREEVGNVWKRGRSVRVMTLRDLQRRLRVAILSSNHDHPSWFTSRQCSDPGSRRG